MLGLWICLHLNMYILRPADTAIITILVFLSVLIPTEYLEDKHF